MNVNSKMTALADEIRELSGTTTPKSIDAMTSDIDAANIEISEQSELITQIATALESKASEGGASIPTCKTISFGGALFEILGTTIVNPTTNQIEYFEDDGGYEYLENVVANSLMYLKVLEGMILLSAEVSEGDARVLFQDDYFLILKIGTSSEVTLTTDAEFEW